MEIVITTYVLNCATFGQKYIKTYTISQRKIFCSLKFKYKFTKQSKYLNFQIQNRKTSEAYTFLNIGYL